MSPLECRKRRRKIIDEKKTLHRKYNVEKIIFKIKKNPEQPHTLDYDIRLLEALDLAI